MQAPITSGRSSESRNVTVPEAGAPQSGIAAACLEESGTFTLASRHPVLGVDVKGARLHPLSRLAEGLVGLDSWRPQAGPLCHEGLYGFVQLLASPWGQLCGGSCQLQQSVTNRPLNRP